MKKLLFVPALFIVQISFGQYLFTDGSNYMTGALNIETQGYASIELKSNTGAFIDFHSSISGDFNGRIIWNYNNSNEFGVYGNATFKNALKVNGNTTLLGNVTNSGTSFVLNSTSQQNATLWLNNPTSGPGSTGHYYLKAFDYWGAYLHFEGAGDNGNEKLNVTFDGKVGIGVTNPSAQFHVLDETVLGSNLDDARLLTRISGKTGNTVMNNIWLRRDSNGSDWFTARIHDGISVDGSYLNPGTDTRTWWERDPYNNIQSWGTANQTYMTLNAGKLAIGTNDFSGGHKLRVEGSIGAREIKVEASGWSDFVFENDYELRTLEEVEDYITQNKHLPEIPSEAEVTENGINLGEMDAKLLQKIEELTLYLIEQNKELKSQQAEIDALKEMNTELLKKIENK